MKTPIVDFAQQYSRKETVRCHVPGHKGLNPMEALDITEIHGADALYHGQGIIAESQRNATALFGTEKTVYSAEGSSLAIRAMVYLAALYARGAGKKPLIAAFRNAHKTFVTAAALLDVQVEWIYPGEQSCLVDCRISPRQLEEYLQRQQPVAVYVTSPDYLGNLADVAGLAKVCHENGVLLLVDNAHGAYLHFLETSRHPIALGADMCCDSAHKTLRVLTGGAYLHISKNAPEQLGRWAEGAMAAFASTSPSYLILQSLDRQNRILSGDYPQKLQGYIRAVQQLKTRLTGYCFAGDEPLKLTICAKNRGYTGVQLGQLLRQQGIECEFCDPDYLVLMLTPENGLQDLDRIEQALQQIPAKPAILEKMPRLDQAQQVISPHEAMMRPWKRVGLNESLGAVLASPSVSCPPAVPVLVCGEQITENAIQVMAYYGITDVDIVE